MLGPKTFLLVVALGLIGSPLRVARAETKVYLLAGQSNMAGVGGYPGTYYPADAPCPAPYNAPQTDVNFWDNGSWVPTQPGFGYQPGTMEFGPEVSFGYTLHNSIDPTDNIYLVKVGNSGTTLADNWNPDGTGDAYNIFKSQVNAAMANLTAAGQSPVIAGMLWMQGETDATIPADAAAYATNLANFIGAVRSDFAAPEMPFVLGRISAYPWGTPDDDLLVRDAQENIVNSVPNTAWFNTDDLEQIYPGHYGTQGQIDLGIRFADEFIPVPEPSTAILLAVGMAMVLTRVYWRRRTVWHARRFSSFLGPVANKD